MGNCCQTRSNNVDDDHITIQTTVDKETEETISGYTINNKKSGIYAIGGGNGQYGFRSSYDKCMIPLQPIFGNKYKKVFLSIDDSMISNVFCGCNHSVFTTYTTTNSRSKVNLNLPNNNHDHENKNDIHMHNSNDNNTMKTVGNCGIGLYAGGNNSFGQCGIGVKPQNGRNNKIDIVHLQEIKYFHENNELYFYV